MIFNDSQYDEVSDFVANFVKTHKNFKYHELLNAVQNKFNFSDMTDEELNHCIQDAWGNEVHSSIYPYGVLGDSMQYVQDVTLYRRVLKAEIQNHLLAIALTKVREPLLIQKICNNLNVKEARKLFKKYPNLKKQLPKKIREKIYPSKLTLIKPLIFYHLMSKENQERLLRDLENNALPSYLLMRKYPALTKPLLMYKLLNKENQARFKKAIKRIFPVNWLLGK